MEDYEYLWLLAEGNPQIDVTNVADTYVAQLVQSRTRFSHVPTDLDATRAAIAQELLVSMRTDKSAIAPGEGLTYELSYTHVGAATELFISDAVPDITPVITATGPGTVQVVGQDVTCSVPVSTGQSVTLTIQAAAVITPGTAVNTAVFSSTQVLTREVRILIYSSQIFLPEVTR
jgi:hypothetical protein